MKRTILALAAVAACATAAVVGIAAPPKAGEAPTVSSLRALSEKELHWGMTHIEVIAAYDDPGGFFDREYAPQLAKLQPGTVMQQLEADRDSRKANFARAYAIFGDTPTGYDLTPLHGEYSYRNEEAIQPLFKDGKKRFIFYIKDHFWKIYDEVPLKAGGPLGATFQEAVTKLGSLLGQKGRIRPADGHDPELTTADWQDATTHLRALDRSGEHLVGIVLEEKATMSSMATLRGNKAGDPFAIDPSIQNVTKGGISDPNAAKTASKPDAGAKNR